MATSYSVQINRYPIVDAELISPDNTMIAIPCLTNPVLSRQLDGWDPEVSIPARIDGKPVNLTIEYYDKHHHRWMLKIPF